jgi:hypothetical protein
MLLAAAGQRSVTLWTLAAQGKNAMQRQRMVYKVGGAHRELW